MPVNMQIELELIIATIGGVQVYIGFADRDSLVQVSYKLSQPDQLVTPPKKMCRDSR